MEWVHYQDQAGFTFDHPPGWRVQTTNFPSCFVTSPDGLWIALIQPLPIRPGLSPADVILKGQFPTTHLFPGARPGKVIPTGTDSAEGMLEYKAADGSPGHAQLVYVKYEKMGLLCAIAAPAAAFAGAEPTLTKIIRSQTTAKANSAPPPATNVQFTRFIDPQSGSFTIDVPVGWHVTGGLNHPGLGDRRAWFECNSPDGIYILSDPTFPHSLCHMKGAANGKVIPVGAGGVFLNLQPGAESSADCYLAQVGSRRLSNFAPTYRRPRPDVVELAKKQVAAGGMKINSHGQIGALETILERKQPGPALVASLLTTCVFNGDYGVGTGFWDSNNVLCVSPKHLAATAESARTRILASMQYTKAMYQIVQQDEMQIYANAQMANAAQWNWFAGQQAAHQAQNATGDAIVNNYWSQQRVNDSIVRGWEQNQAVYDRLSQDRSDEMLDRQRVADDAAAKTYDVAAGSNYYWRDQQTGRVIGTETDQPPDYTNNYTALRKL